jgi:hypothetical protein
MSIWPPGAGWALYEEPTSIVLVVLLQGKQDEKIHRHPDRPLAVETGGEPALHTMPNNAPTSIIHFEVRDYRRWPPWQPVEQAKQSKLIQA